MISSYSPRVLAGVVMALCLQSSVFASTWVPLTITKLTLVNAATNADIRPLSAVDTVDLADAGTALTIRADVNGKVASVAFFLNGKKIIENAAPYALGGDTYGDFQRWTPAVGTHTLRVVPYPSRNTGGQAGAAAEIILHVVNGAAPAPTPEPETEPATAPAPQPSTSTWVPLAIEKLNLVDASTRQNIRALQSGVTISLADEPSAITLGADTVGKVGSVEFVLNGKLLHVDNFAPYTLQGDTTEAMRSWAAAVGTHQLKIVPYPSRDRGGKAGTASEFSLHVVAESSSNPDTLPEPDVVPPAAAASLQLYKANGQLDLSLYGLLALSYDKATMEMRLGPSFLDLSPNAPDTRPTLFRPVSFKRVNGYARTNPYELGGPPKTDSDYWSESGQVAYVPDDESDPGLDRVAVYAYYDRVFAISPRLDYASGRPHPDPQTTEPYYKNLFGEAPKQPIAMVRNYGMQCNEALVLYRDGYLAVAGTQTSRKGSERPYPGFVFPANKVATNIAITTANEFALVTVWDTDTKKGQLAVFALEGKYLEFHTWPYMAMPNQGSWSAFKLLGYVDLPMAMPTSVATASNGFWNGPSQTAGKVLSQIDLSKDGDRKNVYTGSWAGVVAKNGYAIVASKFDNMVALVDLTPLFSYVRESYLSSATSYQQTLAARGTGASNFPQAFSVKPSITPTVVWQSTVVRPTAVLAGHRIDRWTKDYYKAYVAAEDGTISIIDTTPLMKRNSWEKLGSLRIAGTVNVGRNPVSMCFARRGDSDLPLLPSNSAGEQSRPDPYNNLFYVAVRGDRKVVGVVTYQGEGAVYRTITDKRMEDPVAVSAAIRGPILSVTDFRGKKMISFRIGAINDARNDKVFGAGADGNAEFEYAGDVPFKGYPFLINTTNVN